MRVVLDAGVLIGALDANDPHHSGARTLFRNWQRRDVSLFISLVWMRVPRSPDSRRCGRPRTFSDDQRRCGRRAAVAMTDSFAFRCSEDLVIHTSAGEPCRSSTSRTRARSSCQPRHIVVQLPGKPWTRRRRRGRGLRGRRAGRASSGRAGTCRRAPRACPARAPSVRRRRSSRRSAPSPGRASSPSRSGCWARSRAEPTRRGRRSGRATGRGSRRSRAGGAEATGHARRSRARAACDGGTAEGRTPPRAAAAAMRTMPPRPAGASRPTRRRSADARRRRRGGSRSPARLGLLSRLEPFDDPERHRHGARPRRARTRNPPRSSVREVGADESAPVRDQHLLLHGRSRTSVRSEETPASRRDVGPHPTSLESRSPRAGSALDSPAATPTLRLDGERPHHVVVFVLDDVAVVDVGLRGRHARR